MYPTTIYKDCEMQLLHILALLLFFVTAILTEVVSHCTFDLHFPND